MTKKNVSVIVINYNNARYLKRCLDAIYKNQGVQEVIVVDDGSTDNSLEILKKYPVTIIKNDTNVGPVKSRNIGAAAASKSEYILFLDSDAEIQETYVAELADFLEKHENVGVVTGKIISESGERMWYAFGYAPSYIRSFIGNRFNDAYLLFSSGALLKNGSPRWQRHSISILSRMK